MQNRYFFDGKPGFREVITRENSPLASIGFSRIVLEAGGSLEAESGDRELVVVAQSGDFAVDVECSGGTGLKDARGRRSNVFAEKPAAVYVPPSSRIVIRSDGGLEASAFHSECRGKGSAFFLAQEEASEIWAGALGWKRRYRAIFAGNSSITRNLVVGESVTTPGGWIGFPPHKHDQENENEYPLEEIYSFKIKSPHGGLGMHSNYDPAAGYEENFLLHDDMAITIGRGYHTTLAAPGCQLYVLWGLAGRKKIVRMSIDPRFKWMNDAEALF